MAIRILALGIGNASGSMAAKVGGIIITVIGVPGLISCFIAKYSQSMAKNTAPMAGALGDVGRATITYLADKPD
jgi:hypothetical protein